MTTEHLKLLHSDLLDAGIAHDVGGDYKAIFAKRRGESSGKRKKIYAALTKANKPEIDRMTAEFARLFPNGN
jgi:hypothetical protein